MPERTAPRILIVGWDAADWKIIDPLLAAGRTPHLAGLIARGVRGDLSTLQPMLSPLLWTSIATGKTPDKHGILNFVEPEPAGGLRVATSTTRRVKALWNILTQAGRRTDVVGWYATHPAEPIAGTIVSNLFQEGAPPAPDAAWPPVPGAVHPPASAAGVAELRMHPGEVTAAELLALAPRLREMDPRDRRVQLLARLVAQSASIQNAATTLLERQPADCTMVFFETIDVAGHHFMQHHPPRMPHVSAHDYDVFSAVMPAVYEFQDLMLGRLLELAGPDAAVILLSDHGFHSDHLRPAVSPSPDDAMAAMDATWHRPLGVLVMAGPGIKRGDRVYGANILDITPTALTLLGLPVGADMDGRVLVEAFEHEPRVERVFSWDALEGEAGMHPPDLRVDPVEAAGAMQQLVDLGYLAAPAGDAPRQLELLARETRFNLAVVLMTTRRVGESIPIWEELAAAVPNEPRYVLNLAQCYHNVGRYGESREVLARFLEAHPGHADARIHLGAALFAEGRLEEAGGVLEQLERETPGRVDLDTMLGMVYVFLKRYGDAHRVFTRAAATDPHDARAHHGLALVALSTGRYEPAAEHCLAALDLQHFYPDAHYTLGVALTWLGEHRHAIRSFQVAVSMQPGMIDAHRYLASLYRHLGDRENAPRHRDIAQRLMDDRAAGQTSPEHFMRSAPMGPQDWEASLGLGPG
ncbi:MAG: alkaline phosphatase family protein [Phycisphaerales bacterium]|nr:alkaline phosphatase family protein [Phycisphaerales bacterium]